MALGPVFGFKDHFKGLGIFFDTFPNGNHDHSFPYISAMIGDGKRGYDHANDNKGSLAGHGCEVSSFIS
jgi:lectin, mannose-binding 2